MNPEVIVFDLGKVLVDFDWTVAGRQIAARSRRPPSAEHFLKEFAALILRYELGQISTQQLFEEIQRATEFLGTCEEFGRCFADIFTEITPMIELHAALKRKGLPTWIFSNTNELAVEHLRKCYSFFAGFDGYVYSYKHGVMKPDAKLYEVVEHETKRRGAAILYLDDRPENVEAGARRGWQTVLHESPQKTRAYFERVGLVGPLNR